MPPSEVYYDIETQRSADEVGGWHNTHLMRVSVAISWSPADGFKKWEENDIPHLLNYLSKFDRIISFNGDGFDSRVLSAYGDVSPINKKSFDVLKSLKQRLGHRVSLDSVSQATLGVGKTADGLVALRWWKEGKIDQIADYCRQDVQVLVDIVAFGRKNGFVKFASKVGDTQMVHVNW